MFDTNLINIPNKVLAIKNCGSEDDDCFELTLKR